MSSKWFDIVFQTVLGVAAVSALNRMVFHDRLIIAIGCAAGAIAAYWVGRAGVYFVRKWMQIQRLTDE